MLKYKIDVLERLNDAGYTTYRLRNEKLIGEANIQNLRKGNIVGIHTVDTICGLLDIQPGDLLEHEKEQ